MSDVAKDPRAATDPRAAGSGRYSTLAIVLHWLIAAAIVLQIILAGRMGGPRTPESFAVSQLHKSIGITILLLSLLRLGWRLANPPPPMPATMARWEDGLAKIVHAGFYVIMIGMPLTGWIMVSASRFNIPTLLYGVVPWPNVPGLAGLAPAAKTAWHDVGETGHGLLAKLIYVLLALHVAGALKHQLFSRDEPVLARMAPGAVAGRWWEPRLAAIALAAVAVIAFGKLYQPPHPRTAPVAAVTPVGPAQEPAEAQAPTEPATHDAGAPAGITAGGAAAEPTATAQPAAAAPDAEPDAGPVAWTVAPGSILGFSTTWSGDAVRGRFDRWTADILFSPDALDRSKVTVRIDMASARTGDDQRDAALPAPDWFDSANHPTATFTASKFDKLGADRFVAHGVLDLRGVKKPLDLPFTLKIAGKAATVTGATSLDRTAFGVGQGEWKATDAIPAKVAVTVNLRATRR